MLKKVKNITLISVFSILTSMSSAFAEDQYVNVSGDAPVETNKVSAQKKALSFAFRNAVEKGLGVWIKSETNVKDLQVTKDEILTKAEGYVIDHEILKEDEQNGVYTVTIRAKVAVDKLGADFKKLVGRVKLQMGNPSIAFVLTTWKNVGIKISINNNQKTDTSLKNAATDNVSSINNNSTSNQISSEVLASSPNIIVDNSSKIKQDNSIERIDENIWKKYPDMTIIDSFQQEFNEKGFDLKSADTAREFCLSESLAKTAINVNDRKAVRIFGEKEGANFIARGEVQVIDSKISVSTGSYNVTSKVGVEIIDVNSGDIIASYTNTATANSSSEKNAEAQSIKKLAVLAAQKLSSQTIDKWQERALSGRKYTIELKNMESIRQQKLPFIKALQGVAQITSQTSPKEDTLLLDVLYKGEKNALGEALLEQLGTVKGFSENEFDGPIDDNGKIVFKFLKK